MEGKYRKTFTGLLKGVLFLAGFCVCVLCGFPVSAADTGSLCIADKIHPIVQLGDGSSRVRQIYLGNVRVWSLGSVVYYHLYPGGEGTIREEIEEGMPYTQYVPPVPSALGADFHFAGWAETEGSFTTIGTRYVSAQTEEYHLYAVYESSTQLANSTGNRVLTSAGFGCTGSVQSFAAPIAGTYKLEVYGAGGGGCSWDGQSVGGGLGGFASGCVQLNQGDVLRVYVGGAGDSAGIIHIGGDQGDSFPESELQIPGGYNGGENGRNVPAVREGIVGEHMQGAGGGNSAVCMQSGTTLITSTGGGGSALSKAWSEENGIYLLRQAGTSGTGQINSALVTSGMSQSGVRNGNGWVAIAWIR